MAKALTPKKTAVKKVGTKKPTTKKKAPVSTKPKSPKGEVKVRKKQNAKTHTELVNAHLLDEMISMERGHLETNRTHHIIETLLLSIVVLLILILITLIWVFGEGMSAPKQSLQGSPIQHFAINNMEPEMNRLVIPQKESMASPVQVVTISGVAIDIPANWEASSEVNSEITESGETVFDTVSRYSPLSSDDPMRDFIIHGGSATDCNALTQYALCIGQYQLATASSNPEVLEVFASMVSQLKQGDSTVSPLPVQ